jgi:hypothetical protein
MSCPESWYSAATLWLVHPQVGIARLPSSDTPTTPTRNCLRKPTENSPHQLTLYWRHQDLTLPSDSGMDSTTVR